MTRWKKHNVLAAWMLLPFCSIAQQFHYRSDLDTIRVTGFHSIPVTPILSSYLKADLSDIRIADDNNQWVPHIINQPYKNYTNDIVHFDIPIIKKENGSSQTVVVVS